MKRLASIDIGTQTIRLLVADCDDRGQLVPIFRDRKIIRLGEDMGADKNLGRPQMERAVACISEFSSRAKACQAEQIFAAATACVRKASNSNDFIRRTVARTGITPEILSGKQEAELSLAGVRTVTGAGEPSLMIDIGGGSTELVLTETGQPPLFKSLDLGVVLLTEKFLKHDPPLAQETSRMRRCIRTILAGSRLIPAKVTSPFSGMALIGTAGTVTTLAAMDLEMTAYDPGRINGHRLSQQKINALYQNMVKITSAERRLLPGLETGREIVIIAGALIILEIMQILSLSSITVSDSGLLEGILVNKCAKAR